MLKLITIKFYFVNTFVIFETNLNKVNGEFQPHFMVRYFNNNFIESSG